MFVMHRLMSCQSALCGVMGVTVGEGGARTRPSVMQRNAADGYQKMWRYLPQPSGAGLSIRLCVLP